MKLNRPGEAADRYFQAGEYAKAASLYQEAGNEDRLAACLKKLGDWKSLALLHERRGEAAEAVADLKRWLAGDEGRRQQLEAEAAEPPGGSHAQYTTIRRAALGNQAESFALAGRYDEAAQAIERSNLPTREREKKAGEYIAKHLDSPAGRSLHAREALRDAAERLLAEGKPQEALARYRALDDAEGECSAYLQLDRDEEAITRFLESGAVAEARRLMRTRPLRLSAGFLREFVETIAAGDLLASESGRDFAQFAADLLESALPGLERSEALDLDERFMRAVEGRSSVPGSSPTETPKKKPHQPGKR